MLGINDPLKRVESPSTKLKLQKPKIAKPRVLLSFKRGITLDNPDSQGSKDSFHDSEGKPANRSRFGAASIGKQAGRNVMSLKTFKPLQSQASVEDPPALKLHRSAMSGSLDINALSTLRKSNLVNRAAGRIADADTSFSHNYLKKVYQKLEVEASEDVTVDAAVQTSYESEKQGIPGVLTLKPNFQIRINAEKDLVQYFRTEFSKQAFPARFQLSCPSGVCRVCVSFTEPRPDPDCKDMMTMSSLFVLFHPPGEVEWKDRKPRTKAINSTTGQEPNTPSRSQAEQKSSRYMYISIYPFKSFQASLMIKFAPQIGRPKKPNVDPVSATSNSGRILPLSHYFSQQQLSLDDQWHESRLSTAINHLDRKAERLAARQSSTRLIQNELSESSSAAVLDSSRGRLARPAPPTTQPTKLETLDPNHLHSDALLRNKVVAVLGPKLQAASGRLFQKIQTQRVEAVLARKDVISKNRIREILAVNQKRQAAIEQKESELPNTMHTLLMLSGLRAWTTMFYLQRVMVHIRNNVLKKEARSVQAQKSIWNLLKILPIVWTTKKFKKSIRADLDRYKDDPGMSTDMLRSGLALRVICSEATTVSHLAHRRAKEIIGKFLTNYHRAEFILVGCVGKVSTMNIKRYLTYKKDRLEWYQAQWVYYQKELIEASKRFGLDFADNLEADLQPRRAQHFQEMQRKILRCVYDFYYYRHLMKRIETFKSANQTDAYAIDMPKLYKGISGSEEFKIYTKAETFASSLTGFHRLLETSNNKLESRYADLLGFAGDNKADTQVLDALEKSGKIHRLARLGRMQRHFMSKKFVFKLKPSLLVNLVCLAYYLDKDSRVIEFLSKRAK